MKITKFVNGTGTGLATGWDGAYLDGQHSTGHDMRVTVTRAMNEPRFVRYAAEVDGSWHVSGHVEPIGRDNLDSHLPHIWAHCFNAPSEHRTAKVFAR